MKSYNPQAPVDKLDRLPLKYFGPYSRCNKDGSWPQGMCSLLAVKNVKAPVLERMSEWRRGGGGVYVGGQVSGGSQ